MSKYSVDYEVLQQSINQPKFFRLSDVKHKLEKVAFDVVRFVDKDQDIDGLWQIRQSDDGEYIVAMYEEPEAVKQSHWSVIRNASQTQVNIFYKGTPVGKIVLASMQIPSEDAGLVCRFLPEKLTTNKRLAIELLNDLPESEKQVLFSKYPELK